MHNNLLGIAFVLVHVCHGNWQTGCQEYVSLPCQSMCFNFRPVAVSTVLDSHWVSHAVESAAFKEQLIHQQCNCNQISERCTLLMQTSLKKWAKKMWLEPTTDKSRSYLSGTRMLEASLRSDWWQRVAVFSTKPNPQLPRWYVMLWNKQALLQVTLIC